MCVEIYSGNLVKLFVGSIHRGQSEVEKLNGTYAYTSATSAGQLE